jgi:ABC-2 type transport system permease protein
MSTATTLTTATLAAPSRVSFPTAAAVFVGRSMRHSARDVETLLMSIGLPAILMAVFTYVFGGALDPSGRYVDYIVPGIILVCAGFGAAQTAVAVSRDLAEGMVDRLRTMAVPRGLAIFGHVVASTARNLVATAVVVGVGLAMGFRPTAGVVEWALAIGLLTLYIVAITYAYAAIGVVAGSPEAAQGYGFILLFLPYVSSAFVAVDTMPGWLQSFARHQPITPLIDSLRGWLVGGPGDAVVAFAWVTGLVVLGATASSLLFARRAR